MRGHYDFSGDGRSLAFQTTPPYTEHTRTEIDLKAFAERITANIEQVIVGKREAVELAVIGLLAEGHILIKDVPGAGKTVIARSLSFRLWFERIKRFLRLS